MLNCISHIGASLFIAHNKNIHQRCVATAAAVAVNSVLFSLLLLSFISFILMQYSKGGKFVRIAIIMISLGILFPLSGSCIMLTLFRSVSLFVVLRHIANIIHAWTITSHGSNDVTMWDVNVCEYMLTFTEPEFDMYLFYCSHANFAIGKIYYSTTLHKKVWLWHLVKVLAGFSLFFRLSSLNMCLQLTNS